jgi:hypothetical protein
MLRKAHARVAEHKLAQYVHILINTIYGFFFTLWPFEARSSQFALSGMYPLTTTIVSRSANNRVAIGKRA